MRPGPELPGRRVGFVRHYKRIGPRVFLFPRAAVEYIVHMNPRAAAVPLAALFSALIAVTLGALVGVVLAYFVAWLGAIAPLSVWTLGAAPLIGLVCFVATVRQLWREPANVHMRAALLLIFAAGPAVPLLLLVCLTAVFDVDVAGGLASVAFPLVVLWWPIFAILGERRLSRVLRPLRGLCARCGYSLAGLREPRCPECGTEALASE